MEINNLPFSTFPVGKSLNENLKLDVLQQNKTNPIPEAASINEQNVSMEEKLKNNVEDMNKAMEALNSTIRFKIHQETETLMVQVFDEKKNEVIKEFPPHEFLDTKAKIREYIGILLDIKG